MQAVIGQLPCTVEPLYNGPVLSGQFSKFRIFAHKNTVIVTCIKRPWPLFSSPIFFPFFVLFTCTKWPPLNGNLKSHVISRGILLGLIVFKKRFIVTTEITKDFCN